MKREDIKDQKKGPRIYDSVKTVKNLVGDEFHIIMKCDKYKDLRVDFIEKNSNLEENFSNLESQEKLIFIMKLDNF